MFLPTRTPSEPYHLLKLSMPLPRLKRGSVCFLFLFLNGAGSFNDRFCSSNSAPVKLERIRPRLLAEETLTFVVTRLTIHNYVYVSFVHEELFQVDAGCIPYFCPVRSDREI